MPTMLMTSFVSKLSRAGSCADRRASPAKPEETVDENGVVTIVEYYKNDEGNTVKARLP